MAYGPTPLSCQYHPMGHLSGVTQGSRLYDNEDGSCQFGLNPNGANTTCNFAGQLSTLSYRSSGSRSGVEESRGCDRQLRLTSIGAGTLFSASSPPAANGSPNRPSERSVPK